MSNEQREQQIKEAARQRADQYDHPSQWSDTYYGFIDGAHWADKHPQWISVDKELPPKRKDPLVISNEVFIRTTGGHYLSAVYDYQDKQWIDVYNIKTLESNKVIHWMKIVPPRKEE